MGIFMTFEAIPELAMKISSVWQTMAIATFRDVRVKRVVAVQTTQTCVVGPGFR